MRNGYSVAMHAIGALTLFGGLVVGILLITRTAVLCVATARVGYVECAAGDRPYLTAGIVVIVSASIVAVLCFAVGRLYQTVADLRANRSP